MVMVVGSLGEVRNFVVGMADSDSGGDSRGGPAPKNFWARLRGRLRVRG